MTAHVAKPSQPHVHIRVKQNADAARISGVLEALGYQVVRDLDDDAGEGVQRLRWAVERLNRRHRLTPRETQILAGILDGRDNTSLASHLDISRATVKWHVHNLFCKCNVANREGLLRAALQLPGPRRPTSTPAVSDPHDAAPDLTCERE